MALSILGSTGSIGRQTLEVAAHLGLPVLALSGHRNVALLEQQARQFRPRLVAAGDEAAARELKLRLADTPIQVLPGAEGVLACARCEGADTVISAVMGTAGLLPTLAALEDGRRVGLANKESLVCAGQLVLDAAKRSGSALIPVDSEHSAIFQCLQGGRCAELRRILLTASGGPFFGRSYAETASVTPAQALAHPNWHMGPKITVDSATLMNKGLEFIEALRLFDATPEQIEIVVHRESVIHSMVEFCDGSVIAHLANPDMRLPIQYALTWPERLPGQTPPLDFARLSRLTFAAPDLDAFPCLRLALDAARRGGNLTAALSAANEAAVGLFLQERVGFHDIYRLVEAALTKTEFIEYPSIEEILATDARARALATEAV